MQDTQSEMLGTGEVARRFGVDPKTANRWVHEGKFPNAIRTPGGMFKIPASDLDIYLTPAGEGM